MPDNEIIEMQKLFNPEYNKPLEGGKMIIKDFVDGSAMCWGYKFIEATDWLRAHGYDMGYGNIKSLIEAKIAIPKQQN